QGVQHGELLLFRAYELTVDLYLDINLCTLGDVQLPLHFLQTNLIALRELIFPTLHQSHLQEYLVQRFVDEYVIGLVPVELDETRVDH
ncbi:MAG: hypothetical protein ACEQSB_07855, partial [Undibacterium sp.]